MLFRFSDCELDAARLELKRNGQAVPVEPQVRQLLVYLIENRNRVVSRDELHNAVWHSRLVSDATLNSRIRAVRVAIGDTARPAQLIQTLPRTGYRFIGEVEELREPVRSAAGARGTDIEAIVASADDLGDVDLSRPEQPSVVVLPIRTDDGATADGLIADGLTQDLTTQLARARWLFVLARGTSFRFRQGPYDPKQIGAVLGVRYVVQGSVRQLGDRMRIQLDMADSASGREIWADSYWRNLADVADVQRETAEYVVGAIEAEIEHAEQERSMLIAPATLDAWGAYHRGCRHMYRFTPEHCDLAEQFFRRSLELDPNAPRAYAGLSFVAWQRAFLELSANSAADATRARQYAETSLAIDPRDPLGHWALGRAYLLGDDLDVAVEELETATELNPSSAVGQYSLAYALMQVGEADRSNAIVGKARRLSPYDPMTFAMNAVRAQNLAFLGHYRDAARYATRAAMQPNAHYHIVGIAAFTNMLAANTDDARRFYQRLLAAKPGYSADQYLTAFRHRREANSRLVRKTFAALEKLRS